MRQHLKSFLIVSILVYLCTVAASGQQTTAGNSYLLPVITDTLLISKKGYFLAEVVDLRPAKSNIGYIKIDTTKHFLELPDSLPNYIKSFILPSYPESIGHLNPLIIRIERLRIFASTTKQVDIGQIYLKASFFLRTNNELKQIHSFDKTLDYKKSASKDFLSNLVLTSFKTALMGLRARKTEQTSEQPQIFTKGLPPEAEHAPTVIAKIKPGPAVIWNNSEYFIQTVVDSRTSKENEIETLQGMLNRKKNFQVDSSLSYYMHSLLQQDTSANKNPLTLSIQQFRGNETQTSEGERGRIIFSANLSNNDVFFQRQILFDSVAEYDITPAWPSIISQVTRQFLVAFDSTKLHYTVSRNVDSLASDLTIALDEIIIHSPSITRKYYWREHQIKNHSEFKPVFATSSNTKAKKTYKNSRYPHVIGNICLITGSALLAYSALDFLIVETPNYKTWVNSDWKIKNGISFLTKKTVVKTGISAVAIGLILNLIGKSMLHEAIDTYNATLLNKARLSFAPDLVNQNFNMTLDITLGR